MSLISVDDLAARLADPDLARVTAICDARFYLADHDQGRREYDSAHIPGAIFVDVHTDLAGGPGGGRHPLPPVHRFTQLLGRLGISPATFVVAYDSAGGNTAAPTIVRAGFTTGAQARTQWDNDFRQFGESCDGTPDPTNAAWTVRGTDVGRYTCLTEKSVGTPKAAILAVNEQKAFEAQLVVMAPDWPYPTPHNQAELMDWFIKQNEGSFWR